MPAPPYSSGTATPASPSSPAWSKNERGNSPDSSISLARGFATSSANRRTVSCSSFCSSLSSILMVFLCEWRNTTSSVSPADRAITPPPGLAATLKKAQRGGGSTSPTRVQDVGS